MTANTAQLYKQALQFHADNGVDVAVNDTPRDYYAAPAMPSPKAAMPSAPAPQMPQGAQPSIVEQAAVMAPVLGASDARNEAIKVASAANTLEELREAIQSFDGIPLKKTASNMVFSSGNPAAAIMLIGDAPISDDDRAGEAFLGENGALLDKILACIDIKRGAEDVKNSIYLSNILNWRPPGNRSPAQGEIEASLPFIERHIQLAQPKLLIFCGGVAAKALLGRSEGISRLRGKWHDYMPQVEEYSAGASVIPAIATYSPANLLKTPTQKRGMWADILSVQQKREALGLL